MVQVTGIRCKNMVQHGRYQQLQSLVGKGSVGTKNGYGTGMLLLDLDIFGLKILSHQKVNGHKKIVQVLISLQYGTSRYGSTYRHNHTHSMVGTGTHTPRMVPVHTHTHTHTHIY